jgi:hypothetical protein
MEEVWWRNRCGRKDNVAKSMLTHWSRPFVSYDHRVRFLGYQLSREMDTSSASSSKALYQCNSSENEHMMPNTTVAINSDVMEVNGTSDV